MALTSLMRMVTGDRTFFFHSGAVVTMLNTLPPPTPDFFETITSPASATVSKGR